MSKVLLAFLSVLFSPGLLFAQVVTYAAPSGGLPSSSDFTVTAGGRSVAVYRVRVGPKGIGFTPCPSFSEPSSLAYFDFSGSVTIQITSAVPIQNVAIRPLSKNIHPTVNGNTITLSLSQPANLSVEINGDDRRNLHLFANPLETTVPSPSDPNVIYYGPGVHGDGSTIILGDGKTLYVAGGAVVFGTVSGGRDTTIRGRGIITGGKDFSCGGPGPGAEGENLIYAKGGNITLEGFIGLDPAGWTFLIYDTDNFTMDNVKSIAWGAHDGLDLISTSHATIKHVFIRATDDTFAIKADPYFMRPPTNRSSENITISDSVNWADSGAGHAIAFMEQNAPYIRNVLIQNVDIIHTYAPAVYLNCCDGGGQQYNITLDGIRVEDMQGPRVFELSSAGIHDVTVNNFSVLGGTIVPSTISGSSNVTFNKLTYVGQLITSAGQGQFQIGSNTSKILFTAGVIPPDRPPDVAPATGAVLLSASFTGALGTPLTGYTSEIGGGWARQAGSTGVWKLTAAGRALNTSAGVTALTLSAAVPTSTTYDAAWDARVLSLTPGSDYSFWARASVASAQTTGYFASYNVDNAAWRLWAVVADVYTPLGGCSMVPSINTTYHVVLRMRDGTKHLVIDGTQCTSSYDNSVALAGKVGISAIEATASTATTGIHVDNATLTSVCVCRQ